MQSVFLTIPALSEYSQAFQKIFELLILQLGQVHYRLKVDRLHLYLNSFIKKKWHTWQIIFMKMYNYILNSFSRHFRLISCLSPCLEATRDLSTASCLLHKLFCAYSTDMKWDWLLKWYIIPQNAIIFMVIILPSKRDSCQRMLLVCCWFVVGFFYQVSA